MANDRVTQLVEIAAIQPTDANARTTQLVEIAAIQPTDAEARVTQLVEIVAVSGFTLGSPSGGGRAYAYAIIIG